MQIREDKYGDCILSKLQGKICSSSGFCCFSVLTCRCCGNTIVMRARATARLIKEMFNELWKNKREKVLTHTASYLFALSLCDFSLFPRQAGPEPAGLHPAWVGGSTPPHPQNKGVLAATAERKHNQMKLWHLRDSVKCGNDDSDGDKGYKVPTWSLPRRQRSAALNGLIHSLCLCPARKGCGCMDL